MAGMVPGPLRIRFESGTHTGKSPPFHRHTKGLLWGSRHVTSIRLHCIRLHYTRLHCIRLHHSGRDRSNRSRRRRGGRPGRPVSGSVSLERSGGVSTTARRGPSKSHLLPEWTSCVLKWSWSHKHLPDDSLGPLLCDQYCTHAPGPSPVTTVPSRYDPEGPG